MRLRVAPANDMTIYSQIEDSPMIVEIKIAAKSTPCLFGIGVVVQIDLSVLECAPEAFG